MTVSFSRKKRTLLLLRGGQKGSYRSGGSRVLCRDPKNRSFGGTWCLAVLVQVVLLPLLGGQVQQELLHSLCTFWGKPPHKPVSRLWRGDSKFPRPETSADSETGCSALLNRKPAVLEGPHPRIQKSTGKKENLIRAATETIRRLSGGSFSLARLAQTWRVDRPRDMVKTHVGCSECIGRPKPRSRG